MGVIKSCGAATLETYIVLNLATDKFNDILLVVGAPENGCDLCAVSWYMMLAGCTVRWVEGARFLEAYVTEDVCCVLGILI